MLALTENETKLEVLITDVVMRSKFQDLMRRMPKNGVSVTGCLPKKHIE